MWLDIKDYLLGGFEEYTSEFYVEVPILSAVVFLLALLVSALGICRNSFRRLPSDKVHVLITKKELERQKSFMRVTSLLWIIALYGSMASLGIFWGSRADTAWAGVLVIAADIIVFLIAMIVLVVKRSPFSRLLYVFLSVILTATALMQFGAMDLDFSIRLKHVLFFVFVLAVYILFDYALYLVLVDRLNDPFRFARGFYIDNPAEYVWTREKQPEIRVVKPGSGKPVKIRRFNIYNIDEPQYKVRKLTSPKRCYVYYVEDSRVLCANTPDAKTSEHIFYKPLYEVAGKDLAPLPYSKRRVVSPLT